MIPIGATGRLSNDFTGDPEGYLFSVGDPVKLLSIEENAEAWDNDGESFFTTEYIVEVDYMRNGKDFCTIAIRDLNEVVWDNYEIQVLWAGGWDLLLVDLNTFCELSGKETEKRGYDPVIGDYEWLRCSFTSPLMGGPCRIGSPTHAVRIIRRIDSGD